MKYVRSEGERAVQLKAYWLIFGGRGTFGFKRTYAIVFFFSQFRYKVEIKEMSYSDQTTKIIHSHLPRTVKSTSMMPRLFLVF